MQSLRDVSPEDFEAALTPSEIRTSQIIQGTLGIGITLFIFIVFLMYYLVDIPVDTPSPDPSRLQILSLIHLALAGSLVFAGKFIYDMQFSSERLQQIATQGGLPGAQVPRGHLAPPQLCLSLIRAATIIRLALYESIALFGLVVCLLAVVDNVMQMYPVYWLNLLSSLLVVTYILATLPNRPRMQSVFMGKIKQAVT